MQHYSICIIIFRSYWTTWAGGMIYCILYSILYCIMLSQYSSLCNDLFWVFFNFLNRKSVSQNSEIGQLVLILGECTIGWVDIGTRTKVPLKFVTYHSKITKINDPVTASSLVKTFWVMHYTEVQNFFPTIWTSWVSKDAEFYVDFKNINLP
jgi:hypothetical protein